MRSGALTAMGWNEPSGFKSAGLPLSSGATKGRLRNDVCFRKVSLLDKLSCLNPGDFFKVPSKVFVQCFGFD
jgi:hypothetical protein